MRTGRFLQRAGKEFARRLIWFLVVYAPIAAILTLSAGVSLRGVLFFGGVLAPVMVTVITVLMLLLGGDDEACFGGDPGSRSASAYLPGGRGGDGSAGDADG